MVDILNNRGWNLMGIAHYAIRLVLSVHNILRGGRSWTEDVNEFYKWANKLARRRLNDCGPRDAIHAETELTNASIWEMPSWCGLVRYPDKIPNL